MIEVQSKRVAYPEMTIMIVEDNPSIRRLIRYVLNDDRNIIIECANGAAALEAYTIHRPNLVLMDIQMPGLDGLEVTRLLRERDPDARIHIVSDFDEQVMRAAAESAGACGFTSKVNLDQLDTIISRYSP